MRDYQSHGNLIFNQIKWEIFQAIAVSVLPYDSTTWTQIKCLVKKKLIENFTKILHAILNKSRKDTLQNGRSMTTYFQSCKVCGAFNKFPDFFVQAFKIAVDSWKFTMLLLYILWDSWPIFMILDLNEQLQQQLEYTLLKPDCYSWWISKMQSGHEDTLEEWYTIKLCFKLGKNATETYGMLHAAFGPSGMNRTSVFEWHKRFKEGGESVRDDKRSARSKEVNTPELIG